MSNKKEKNNREFGSFEETNRGATTKDSDKDNKYTDENLNTTDSDAAESNPRIKHASQVSGNTAEEGDEDYDDEEDKKI